MFQDNPLFHQGLTQFQSGDYYPCHDSLEAVWMETPEFEKPFVQGILQIAVACYHLTNGNQKGCMILLGEGIKRLKDFLPNYAQVDVETLMRSSSQFLRAVQRLEADEVESLGAWIKSHGNQSMPWLDAEGNEVTLPLLQTLTD